MITIPKQATQAFDRFAELNRNGGMIAKSKAYDEDMAALIKYIGNLEGEVARLQAYEQDSIKCDRILAAFNRFCGETGVFGPCMGTS